MSFNVHFKFASVHTINMFIDNTRLIINFQVKTKLSNMLFKVIHISHIKSGKYLSLSFVQVK